MLLHCALARNVLLCLAISLNRSIEWRTSFQREMTMAMRVYTSNLNYCQESRHKDWNSMNETQGQGQLGKMIYT